MSGQSWTWDESVVVLDAYRSGLRRGKRNPRVVELSKLLCRSPQSIDMKLGNFLYLDEQRKGLSKGTALDREVWGKFAHDQRLLRSYAGVIQKQARQIQEAGWSTDAEPIDAVAEALEGKILTRYHVFRERNRKLVEAKKKSVLRKSGRLACEACGFDFAEKYGKRGVNFIECHHTKPLSDLKSGTRTNLNDLALVCSNCHRMIHVRRPWLKVADLKKLIDGPASSS